MRCMENNWRMYSVIPLAKEKTLGYLFLLAMSHKTAIILQYACTNGPVVETQRV